MTREPAGGFRSAATERVLTLLTGVVLVVLGGLVLLVSFGVLGTYRATRPVLDPIAVDWVGRQPPTLVRVVVLVLAVALVGFGLWWLVRSLRPQPRPDVTLDDAPGHELTVTAAALTTAVRADAEAVTGVRRARVRTVGAAGRPALRLTLWLAPGTDLRQVWAELDGRVLARARESLGLETLPATIHLELDAGERPRVH
ncbi:hypothetical protein SAMN05421810_110157 [Amycolatopsis arida]|uniref:Alkaline shock response membrane anchor protein AmaP n=1 Tax=Amycolatopsis arida TaxID=587909 RepID=A0A1I5ZVG5_9PSEU|nr:alkaline shock response membrane anchor protein AmaP [Amycolatopsis arida]TDX89390.1 hypothetical protein CLV69_110158 [Amycolatopsis arida]SFQ60333.1 hypothetical protein SAMN05421810_110157 [Amycolatopsis arida]